MARLMRRIRTEGKDTVRAIKDEKGGYPFDHCKTLNNNNNNKIKSNIASH